jgi:hypothetical protein
VIPGPREEGPVRRLRSPLGADQVFPPGYVRQEVTDASTGFPQLFGVALAAVVGMQSRQLEHPAVVALMTAIGTALGAAVYRAWIHATAKRRLKRAAEIARLEAELAAGPPPPPIPADAADGRT